MDFDSIWYNLKWVCIWFAVVFGALSLALAIGVAVKRRDKMMTFVNAWFATVVGFAVVVGVYAFVLTCRQMSAEGEIIPLLFYPIGATILVGLVSCVLMGVLQALHSPKVRLVNTVCAALFGAGILITLVFIGKYYVDVIRDSGYYANVSTVALVIGSVVLTAALVLFAVFCGRKTDKSRQTQSVVFAGVSVALSFALSYVTFFKMPQGGSITLASMLPIMIYSYRYGTRRGILAGLVYGLLQAVQDPWIIHPAQFLLDYPLAFAMLGVAGWLRTLAGTRVKGVVCLAVGGVTAVVLRYVAHVISGIFAFSSYAMPGYGAVAWGFLYNTFELVDGVICLVLGGLLYANKAVRRLVYGESSASAVNTQEAMPLAPAGDDAGMTKPASPEASDAPDDKQ